MEVAVEVKAVCVLLRKEELERKDEGGGEVGGC